MEAKDTQLQLKDDQLQQKDDQLQQKDTQLQQRNSQLQYLGTELGLAQSQLQQLQVNYTCGIGIRFELMYLCLQAEMDARSAQTQQQLQDRDAEINRLQRELRVSHH